MAIQLNSAVRWPDLRLLNFEPLSVQCVFSLGGNMYMSVLLTELKTP